MGYSSSCQLFETLSTAFLRRLVDLTKGIRKPNHHVRLTKDTKHDIIVWHDFIPSYNGNGFLRSRWETSKSLNLFTDAAGSLGYAATFVTHCFFQGVAQRVEKISI